MAFIYACIFVHYAAMYLWTEYNKNKFSAEFNEIM